jgi:ribosomal protein S18 acetylase RimI-like enzyme
VESPRIGAGDVSFRPAVEAESDLLADIVIGVPEQETTRVAMRLFGIRRFEHARALFRVAWRAGENWGDSTLAEIAGEPVGALQTRQSDMRITPGVALAAVRTLPPGVLVRMPNRLRVHRRVRAHMPHGAFVISELHVAPAWRSRGIGEILLERAEREARGGGFATMGLTTLTTNPARRLYERFGFRVVSTRTDAEFARLTGTDGNLLMVKSLS